MTAIVLMVVFMLFLISGAPIYVAIGVASIVSIATSSGVPDTVFITRLFGGLDKFAVMALPFYIFSANVMDAGGLSEKIVKWAKALVGKMAGGIAVATEVACMAFGALSGSAPATVVAIGKIMTPRLEAEGYDKGFIAGLITSSGAVAIIIPPSIVMMLYAASTGTSTGSLFIGGVFPGIVFGLATALYCVYYAKKHKIKGAAERAAETGVQEETLWQATKSASWSLGVPIIIIGGIYAGIATATEVAGISVIYALFVGTFIYKKIKWKDFWQVTLKSTEMMAQVMTLISVASVFAWLLTTVQLPQKLAEVAMSAGSPVIFMLLMNFVLLIAGMFMDPNSLVIILGPIFFSVGNALGLDPIHIGIIITVNLAIGMFTPPFGLNLFVANTVIKAPMTYIYKSVIPFIIISISALLLITFIPQLTTFLPGLAY